MIQGLISGKLCADSFFRVIKAIMRNILTTVQACFIFFAIFVSATSVHAQFMDRVLVIVNDDVITLSQFEYRMKTVRKGMLKDGLPEDQINQASKELLDAMVSETLQIQEASRRGLSVTDAEVEDAIERYAAQQQMSVSQFKASLIRQGESLKQFSQTVRDSLNISRLTEYYAFSRVVVPDYEIDALLAQGNAGGNDNEYRIAHILIKEPDQNQQLAELVLSELNEGKSFQEAALVYSQAADAQDGGILGWRTEAQLPEIFVTAIKSIEVGQITNILRSDNGLHILKLLDMKGNREEVVQNKVRHILITANTDVARIHATKRLREIRQRILNGEDFDSLARIYSDDSVSAANGGELGWVSPDEMVPQFEQTFTQIPINQISEPFDTNYGVHILQVLERRTKNITEDLKRAQADNILRRRRAEREFGQWVRQLREESYVEYLSEPV